ncbi:Uu.00g081270.m01.CDS01 [Anthostomella pinea]|uniref:Uu.00g081270.m01.CDS01 n=1 Tax=Anthostomella pinea TaxID=933095 RepID=A0AAI8VM38_9PEZI|nr:Uu.00g081270.m01.CDS01 [Anthostomella pinea]
MPVIPNDSSNGGVDWGHLGTEADGHDGSTLGNWSSLIGIVTAIVGNMLIALALNVQRYSHIQLHRRRVEARGKAREAMKRVQEGRRDGYGTADTPEAELPGTGGDDTDAMETHPLARSFQSGDSGWSERSGDDSKVTSTYLKSPSWWLGQVLMTVGEMGNFLAYGFAPASIVSPLGVVALISNCVIAPLFFGEVFRKRDFWGVVIAVGGAVTVVLSANTEETKLNPHDVWDAITTLAFEIYLGVTIFIIIVLMWASPRYGNRTILIDLGLVGLFGGYTALTTKGVSSMLSSTLFGAFATPVTYGLIIVLLATAVMQVRYVNKALQRFDSTQVIPIQFVIFTLSVIIGSAILYRDFERTSTEQAAKFVGGCLLTFFGVFLITSGRPRHDDDDELSDDDNVEETIGLRDQEGSGPYIDVVDEPSAASSRRSSRASRVNFAGLNLLTPQGGSGTPSSRRQDASSRTSLAIPAESSPLLNNTSPNKSVHPGFAPTFSADSVQTIHSASTVVPEPMQSSINLPQSGVSPAADRPVTPRPSLSMSRPHSHHYSKSFISPSPLSSTVSAVVADALRRGEEVPTGRRRSVKHPRPSIRASIFAPNDDDESSPVAEPLIRSISDREPAPNQGEPHPSERRTLRGRTRSLSHTLGDFFGRKKKRRDFDTEAGESHEDSTSDPPGPPRIDNDS